MAMRNEINASSVNKEVLTEQETINAKVKVDVAVALPILTENVESNIKLDYATITQVVNDYVERFTIDSRINEIEYELSTPKLPDEVATNNLKEALSGETNELSTSKEVICVDNSAIIDDKVTLKFELSAEEKVYLNETEENDYSKQSEARSKRSIQSGVSSIHSGKSSRLLTGNSQSNGELIIKSAEPKLYWQNSPSAQLYFENAPQNDLYTSQNNSLLFKEIKDTIIGVISGMNRAADSVGSSRFDIEKVKIFKQAAKIGDNGKMYFNPYARGNQYYKIVGNIGNVEKPTELMRRSNAILPTIKFVKRLGLIGKVVDYGNTAIETGIEYNKAETSQEKGRVVGASLGKVAGGALAGSVTMAATTAVLVTIAGVAGVAAAPVTLIVIAGCSIIAATAASNMAEKYGEELGGEWGGKAVELWQNRAKE